MLPKRRTDLLIRTVEDEVVILDRTADRIHQLNTTASCIWHACDGTRTPEQIASSVAARCETAPDALLADVLQALADFDRLGLLSKPDSLA